ncbi:MAG: ABC transporter ATP-binding protein [Thermoleophilia bacterium]
MTDSAPIIAARGISRRFGRRSALEPLDIDVRAGEALALVGPNGAGKSTLLAILAGALAPSAGELRVADGATVGWVPQRPAVYSRLSAIENLVLFARLEGIPDPAARARELLDRVELPADDRPAGRLSGGNQQRLNLAVALLARPRVLLLDEPTAALDPRQRRRFWEIVDDLPRQGGAVVFATQNLEELGGHASRVAVLADGRLAFLGTREAYAVAPEAQVFG